MVTARHVLELVVDDKIRFIVHARLPSGQPAADQLVLSLRPSQSARVPATGEDIAVLRVEHASIEVSCTRREEPTPGLFTPGIGDDLIHDNEWLLTNLAVVHTVCMLSYPVEQFDDTHQLPIIRTGVTCTPPGLDYRGRPEGYTDISAHAGDSGSPVLILERGVYATKRESVAGTRCIFLGVHKGGLQNAEESRPELELTTGCYVKAAVLRKIDTFVPFSERPPRM